MSGMHRGNSAAASINTAHEEVQQRNLFEPRVCCQGVAKEIMMTRAEVKSAFYSIFQAE